MARAVALAAPSSKMAASPLKGMTLRGTYSFRKNRRLRLYQVLSLSLIGLALLLGFGLAPVHAMNEPEPKGMTLTLSIKDLTVCVDAPFTCPYPPLFEAMLEQGGCPNCALRCRAQMKAVIESEMEDGFVSLDRMAELEAENMVCELLELIFGAVSGPKECNVADEPVECILRR